VVLVAVRIALSFSLDIEVDGMLPWPRAQTDASLRSRSGDDAEDQVSGGSNVNQDTNTTQK